MASEIYKVFLRLPIHSNTTDLSRTPETPDRPDCRQTHIGAIVSQNQVIEMPVKINDKKKKKKGDLKEKKKP